MSAAKRYPVAIVGVGKIARDQHIPSIERSARFQLAAGISRQGRIEGVEHFTDFDRFLAERADVPVVSLCMPPQVRCSYAEKAIRAGRHVMLEKPPGATVSEVEWLARFAAERGVSLFATWHSRFASGVPATRAFLAAHRIDKVEVIWKEDVRRWHPGQDWIWEPGGTGVFDPGINALSIVTAILPLPVRVTAASLSFPENRQTPIAADLVMTDPAGTPITAAFDWRQDGPQTWDVVAETSGGRLVLSAGGSRMAIDGREVPLAPEAEYDGIYARMADLLDSGQSDVDAAPLRLVADAHLIGRRLVVDAFHD